ncbi:L-2-haloalkanoic acid dehalogenase [Bacillus sp. FJAT-27916]|uniref:HAD family hydrolase n=1 Tax=Bacillaceae TaxID=186817 RepID=UPI00067137C5|nr:HAD family hydrolase [Bacillus sp. FJAT-27916]KMY44080.1 L-2-haloalkanoic acid dehalogenase [Bacillus sp. FJAT-27916]
MIKAILFDLDGTLLDRDRSVKEFVENQYDRLISPSKPVSKGVYVSRFLELDNRGYVWKDRVYEQLVHEYHMTEITSESLLQDYLNHFKDWCIAFPHMLDMLQSLREKQLLLGIISNGRGRFQMDAICGLGIREFFDVILLSEWEGIKKPDLHIFLRAANRLGVSPHECVFVGDHPLNDVRAAQKAGMKTIWKRDANWQEPEAGIFINDLVEIPLLVEKLRGNEAGDVV